VTDALTVISCRMPQPDDEPRHIRRRREGDPNASGPSGRGGAHREPRRLIVATARQLATWDRLAARAGLSWADWARSLMDAAPGRPALALAKEGPFPGRRLLSATAAQWASWDAKARAAGLSWSDWARRLQDAA